MIIGLTDLVKAATDLLVEWKRHGIKINHFHTVNNTIQHRKV